ncbi:hypothetical protein [Micromonospora inositola]|uniref:hypothetical protein n=1 Tax=Micromonospora inositola TaxID=47865 RepID=UPI0038CC1B9B
MDLADLDARDLGLDAAGVRTTEAGAIEVDECLRTSQPHIYDVETSRAKRSSPPVSRSTTAVSSSNQLTGEGRRSTTDRVVVPRTLFMTPPLATVGMTEREARQAGHRVKIASQPVAEIVAMPGRTPSRRPAA